MKSKGYSVFAPAGRKVWYVKFVDPNSFAWRTVVTAFRIDDPAGERRAVHFASEQAANTARRGPLLRQEAWTAWVKDYLGNHYQASPLTLQRYLGAWKHLQLFLHERKIVAPANLTYQLGIGYMDWRTAKKRNNGHAIAHNTALVELKVLSTIMREAVRRGFATGNPLDRPGIKRAVGKEKPELSDAEIGRIRAALVAKEGGLPIAQRWMTVAFEVAIHQGCRLSETSVPMELIDEGRGVIQFRTKGHGHGAGKKMMAAALHPGLRPLLAELRAAGATHTCILPKMATKLLWQFRQANGLGHTCFHSTRVTVVTRLARAGVSEQQAMAYVGHSSQLVHKVYQRLRPQDLAACTAALNFPAAAATGPKD